MRPSFKLKIALFAACASGAVFLAFACLLFSVVRRTGLDRLDRQLQGLADAQLRRGFQYPEQWAFFDSSLASLHGDAPRRRFLLKVTDDTGAPLYTSDNWPDAFADIEDALPPLPPPPPRLSPPAGRPPPFRMRTTPPLFHTRPADGRHWRLVVMRAPNATVRLAADMAPLAAELRRLRTTFAITGPIVLLLLAAAGWLLAGQALRPVQTLTRAAADLTARDLARRVATPGADREFQTLTDVINGMLERLEKSFRQAARFSADAAHELKTPLAILQGQLHQALQNAPRSSAEQQTYSSLLDEVQRLKAITRKLLLLAQSDAGQLPLAREPLDLSKEIALLLDDAATVTPALRLDTHLAPGVTVMADPDLTRQSIRNLISNAVRHSRPDTTVHCRLTPGPDGQGAVFTIANTLPDGPAPDPARLFERFYRADPSRSRRVDGSGLGLSLAREIIRAHGGDLTLDPADTRDNQIAFRLTLPA